MKVSTENDNNFGYEKITIVVDNIPLKGKPGFRTTGFISKIIWIQFCWRVTFIIACFFYLQYLILSGVMFCDSTVPLI